FLDREGLGGRVVRPGLAERRILRLADLRCEPDLGLLVHDQAVDAGLRVPDRFLAPIGRWRHGVVLARLHARIACWHVDRGRCVGMLVVVGVLVGGSNTGNQSVLSRGRVATARHLAPLGSAGVNEIRAFPRRTETSGPRFQTCAAAPAYRFWLRYQSNSQLSQW